MHKLNASHLLNVLSSKPMNPRTRSNASTTLQASRTVKKIN